MRPCSVKDFFRLTAVAACMAAPLAVGACSMDRPSWSVGNQQRVELRSGREEVRMITAGAGEAALAGVAEHYRSSGEGPVHVTVTYDPKSKTNTAMKATAEVSRIAGFLRRRGKMDVTSDIMPVSQSGNGSETLITYGTVTAHAPRDCYGMGGVDGRATGADENYTYGCTIEMQVARQIANPKDMKGNEGLKSAETDGRRLSNIVEGHRTGAQNAALQGESATSQ